jgi:hypothetical protein
MRDSSLSGEPWYGMGRVLCQSKNIFLRKIVAENTRISGLQALSIKSRLVAFDASNDTCDEKLL